MCFHLTSDITIGKHVQVKAANVKWKTSVNNFTDTCTIDLPRITYLKTVKSNSEDLQKTNERQEYDIKEGDPITVLLGYDGRNEKRFQGFVKVVNQTVPVKVECEGYSYLLYDVIFNRSYQKVTAKQLLKDVCQSTAIVVSNDIPDIPLSNVRFKNATGIQVLEWLQKECKLAVYFNFDELYCGTLFGKTQAKAKFRLGWNTVSDDDFKQRQVDKNVKIVIKEKDPTGKVNKTPSSSKYSDEKTVKVKAGIPATLLKQIADRLQTKSNYSGFEGKIKAFLEPAITKGGVAEIDGYRYPEKSGSYFVEELDGEFGKSGGRQIMQLGFIMTGNANARAN